MNRKAFLSLTGFGSIGTASVCAGCSKSVNACTTRSSVAITSIALNLTLHSMAACSMFIHELIKQYHLQC